MSALILTGAMPAYAQEQNATVQYVELWRLSKGEAGIVLEFDAGLEPNKGKLSATGKYHNGAEIFRHIDKDKENLMLFFETRSDENRLFPGMAAKVGSFLGIRIGTDSIAAFVDFLGAPEVYEEAADMADLLNVPRLCELSAVGSALDPKDRVSYEDALVMVYNALKSEAVHKNAITKTVQIYCPNHDSSQLVSMTKEITMSPSLFIDNRIFLSLHISNIYPCVAFGMYQARWSCHRPQCRNSCRCHIVSSLLCAYRTPSFFAVLSPALPTLQSTSIVITLYKQNIYV